MKSLRVVHRLNRMGNSVFEIRPERKQANRPLLCARSNGCAARAFRPRCAGFTLVELLASIAIIALLAAVLLSASGSVFRAGKDVKCVGNLHTLSIASANYCGDWGYWPSQNRENPYDPSQYGGFPWWFSLIQQGYLTSKVYKRDGFDCLVADSLICPSNQLFKGVRYPYVSYPPYPWSSNYTINAFWGDSGGAPAVIPGFHDRVRVGAVTNPSAIYLIDSGTGSTSYPGGSATAWSSTTSFIPSNLHKKGANALLANGAVVIVSLASYPDIENTKYWDPRYVAPH